MAQSKGQRRAQQQRLQQKWQQQLETQTKREQRATAVAANQAKREAQRQHVEARAAEAEQDNADLAAWLEESQSILTDGLQRSAQIDLRRRQVRAAVPDLVLGELEHPLPMPQWPSFAPPPPGRLGKAFGGEARYTQRLAEAERDFAAAQARQESAEAERRRREQENRAKHAERVSRARAEAEEANAQLQSWLTGLAARDRESVERYHLEVLTAVPLPDGYPVQAEVTFATADEHAFVQYELPPMTVLPQVKSVSYVKTRDELVPKRFTAKELTSLYRSVVSQVSLLVVRDLFDADPQLRQVSFNGMVHRTNPGTGQPEYPCLISLMVERAEFEGINLQQATPEKCLKHLKAQVTNHPDEVEGVPAFFDFDKTRYAFVEGVDVVAGLDHRPDLMALSPGEFEHLVRQVFEATPGMTGWTTRASRDDGVDAVIRNSNPVTGGLTVVQAKQYSHSIGVSHVRELYGTMEDTRAGHGILVTTSTFTKDAKLLALRLVRIQLIDGAALVNLIKRNLDKDVLIGKRPKKP